jgi:hypothetical protein
MSIVQHLAVSGERYVEGRQSQAPRPKRPELVATERTQCLNMATV